MVGLQGCLLDATPDEVAVGPVGQGLMRRHLDARSWVDLRPHWVSGADALFADLAAGVPWRAERRQMYDAIVDVPRLVAFHDGSGPFPHPSLDVCRDLLTAHYAAELGEPFVTAGFCYYRDGRDSVAWHGDRIGRSRSEDTMIAILSLGAPRTLALRPNGGATAYRAKAGHGDLLVMGGACQRDWEHAVPKTATATGPRISVQFRVAGVR